MVLHSSSIGTHCQAHISGTYVSYVQDHQEESRFFQAKGHLSATDDEFHPQAAATQRQIIQFTRPSPQRNHVRSHDPSNNDKALSSSAIIQTLGVESVVKQEIQRVLYAVPLTPRNDHKLNKIMSNWRKLQMKRLRNEHYLPSTFIDDVQRSKIELKFVIKQLKFNYI
jgi:D-serine deaminase-like pyridoxal phosphate-dependent protein